VKVLREGAIEIQRAQLAQTLAARQILQDQIIVQAQAANAGIYEKLAALEYLDKQERKLTDSVGLVTDSDNEASRFLQDALPLKSMESKFSASVDLSVRPDGTLNVKWPIPEHIIEGESKEPEEE